VSRILAGRFRLDESLGSGGTAVVYRARDLTTGGEVAIKELRPQFADQPATRLRFVREAEAARGLTHPAIVRVEGVHEHEGRPFLVMELVRGETLRGLLGRLGPLGEGPARRIAAILAGALDHAHQRGVIHRDIKPENVFLTGPAPEDVTALATDPRLEERIKLCDFGQARVTSMASLTGTSLAWGTPEYMAPEAFARGRLDPRTDLYGLGVLVYELITGRLPWTRAQALGRIGMAIAGTRFELPPTGAAADLDQLLADLLAPTPAGRPESGATVIERLLHPAPAALEVAVKCMGCGAALAPDLPLCLGCGQATARFAHQPGERWRLVLLALDDDAQAIGQLLDLLGAVAVPHGSRIAFLVGDLALYSDEERKEGTALPAVLFSDLDQPTARELERLFRSRGLEVEAREGAVFQSSIAEPTMKLARPVIFTGMIAVGFTSIFESLAIGIGAGAAGALVFGLAYATQRRRRASRSPGMFTLRGQPVPVAVADRMLADAAAAHGRLRAPEARQLLGDLIAVLHRLARRAGQGAPPDLARRLLQAAPALARQIAATAERLDALETQLDQASDAEMVQEWSRLERRLGSAAAADRPLLAASRRDLETALGRRHQLEQERERLTSGLCLLLGKLRAAARHAEARLAVADEEARSLEAATAELDAFLASPAN
jgi:tRNA A-37 threonylcarbamoyl transferase component Bud32